MSCATSACATRPAAGRRPRVRRDHDRLRRRPGGGGRALGALGHPSDRDLLRAVREEVDAVLVGPGTLRAEGYANLLDPDQRARRVPRAAPRPRRGRDDHRLARRPDGGRALRRARGHGPRLHRPARGGPLARRHRRTSTALGDPTPRAVLRHLRAEAGARAVACEGGPTLLRALVADGCLDDLLLTLAPLLVAGDEVRPLEGPELAPPAALALEQVLRAGDHLLLHYRRRVSARTLRLGDRVVELRARAPAGHGDRQREPGLVLRRGAATTLDARSRTRAGSWPRAPTSSTSAASRA